MDGLVIPGLVQQNCVGGREGRRRDAETSGKRGRTQARRRKEMKGRANARKNFILSGGYLSGKGRQNEVVEVDPRRWRGKMSGEDIHPEIIERERDGIS